MGLETWLAFAAASAVLLAIPGPTILLVVSYALGRGWKVAAPVATGVALGDLTAMTLSMLGVGALLAGSAALFTVLKWVGAGYLVFLGVKLWRAGSRLVVEARTVAAAPGRRAGDLWRRVPAVAAAARRARRPRGRRRPWSCRPVARPRCSPPVRPCEPSARRRCCRDR